MGKKKQKRLLDEQVAKRKQLKKEVSTLKAQVTRTEKKLAKAVDRAERFKKEAKAHKKSASKAGARADLLQEQIDQASADLRNVPSEPEAQAASVDAPAQGQESDDGMGTPNDDWSVVQLRSEARSRGLTGMSKKTKAELIEALR